MQPIYEDEGITRITYLPIEKEEGKMSLESVFQTIREETQLVRKLGFTEKVDSVKGVFILNTPTLWYNKQKSSDFLVCFYDVHSSHRNKVQVTDFYHWTETKVYEGSCLIAKRTRSKKFWEKGIWLVKYGFLLLKSKISL